MRLLTDIPGIDGNDGAGGDKFVEIERNAVLTRGPRSAIADPLYKIQTCCGKNATARAHAYCTKKQLLRRQCKWHPGQKQHIWLIKRAAPTQDLLYLYLSASLRQQPQAPLKLQQP